MGSHHVDRMFKAFADETRLRILHQSNLRKDGERLLFVCIHNSGRSQMAEALLRHLGGECFDESSSERCPIFPGLVRERMRWSFKDPAGFQGSPEERLAKTREVRDQIRNRIEEFLREAIPSAGR